MAREPWRIRRDRQQQMAAELRGLGYDVSVYTISGTPQYDAMTVRLPGHPQFTEADFVRLAQAVGQIEPERASVDSSADVEASVAFVQTSGHIACLPGVARFNGRRLR